MFVHLFESSALAGKLSDVYIHAFVLILLHVKKSTVTSTNSVYDFFYYAFSVVLTLTLNAYIILKQIVNRHE